MIPSTHLSEHLTYAEATVSQEGTRRGIDNTPNDEILAIMKTTAEKLFEPIRALMGKPVTINSFYRSIEVNKLIGGVPTSQHCKGEAIDLHFPDGNAILFNAIKNSDIEFDQLLWEYGDNNNPAWVHVSYSSKHNRKQILKVSLFGGQPHWEVVK
jgi:zinc D-Ala-D-Ala carboxypeptidase